ncbi:MAG: DUF4234 domain-containing protein [Acidimicrobiia bacterium]|nr:DUF4234 domain-containing protein [Acidimicrobiia bacterium]
MAPADRVRAAYEARGQSASIVIGPGLNVFLAFITCGIFGLYLFYQLMRRDRDHLLRRYQLLEGANAFAWERANTDGLTAELTPAFERTAVHLETMRRQTTEFRDPAIWLLISLLVSGIAEIIGFIFIDQDLDTHDRTEGALESELAEICARLGQALPTPDPSRVKGRQNYTARIVVTIVTCGIYHFWWLYDMQVEGNRHLEANWPWEDALAVAVQAMVGAQPS